jgi:hypothetical protein
MGFLAISDQSGPAFQNRKETVRFPGEPAQQTEPAPSGFVSMIVRRDA